MPTETTKVTFTIERIYMGRRINRDNKISYFWIDAENMSDVDPSVYVKQPIKGAQLGQRWRITFNEDQSEYFVRGEHRPVHLGLYNGEEIQEWQTLDRAAAIVEQMNSNARKDLHDDEILKALRPIQRIIKKARTYKDRSAIVALVIDALYNS